MSRAATRVLCLFPSFTNGTTGGVQVSGRIAWDAVRRAMEERGGQARLLSYGRDGQKGAARAGRRIAEHAGLVSSRLGAVRTALARSWDADLVLVWHVGLLRLLPFLRIGRSRVVLFLHGIEVWRRPTWITRSLLGQVHQFLSNSAHTRRRFLDFHPWLSDVPHRLVPLGLETPAPARPAPTDPPAALMLGRLLRSEDYKGHREMIRAWPHVRQTVPHAQLWIAGEGDLKPALEETTRQLGLRDAVRFCGPVCEDEKRELVERCRCLALPSRGEGFGLVYLEAMRMGRPCLVSTCDAGREVVSPPECGLEANPRDIASLAHAAGRLVTPGADWERWSAAACRRYEQAFTRSHFQKRLVESLLGNAA